jgi:pimeloyl-ACP methyl ester carboxylesterase
LKSSRPTGTSLLAALSFVLFSFAIAQQTAAAQVKDEKPAKVKSGFITTPDGVKIHYLEAGHSVTAQRAQVGNPLPADVTPTKGNIALSPERQFPSILFVPGWTMPAWIWENQISYFSKDYRVVAMDPRSQGDSSQVSDGLYPAARARDIKAVVTQLHLAPVVIVAWSMAVVETMAYIDQFGTADFAGFVFVDNDAGGRAPGGADQDFGLLKGLLEDRQNATNGLRSQSQFQKTSVGRISSEGNPGFSARADEYRGRPAGRIFRLGLPFRPAENRQAQHRLRRKDPLHGHHRGDAKTNSRLAARGFRWRRPRSLCGRRR